MKAASIAFDILPRGTSAAQRRKKSETSAKRRPDALKTSKQHAQPLVTGPQMCRWQGPSSFESVSLELELFIMT
jgi:hypothetical protein